MSVTMPTDYSAFDLELIVPLAALPTDAEEAFCLVVRDRVDWPHEREYVAGMRSDVALIAGSSVTVDGIDYRFVGAYFVSEVSAGGAVLRIGSSLPCVEFDWCQGHEVDHRREIPAVEHGYHASEVEELTSSREGSQDLKSIRMQRLVDDGVQTTAVMMTLDANLSNAGLEHLASELVRAAERLRSIAGGAAL